MQCDMVMFGGLAVRVPVELRIRVVLCTACDELVCLTRSALDKHAKRQHEIDAALSPPLSARARAPMPVDAVRCLQQARLPLVRVVRGMQCSVCRECRAVAHAAAFRRQHELLHCGHAVRLLAIAMQPGRRGRSSRWVCDVDHGSCVSCG